MKRTFHVGQTLGVGMAHGIMVIAHGKKAPSREDWAALCEAIATEHTLARGQLVVSRGGVPDAAQRRAAIAVLTPGFVAPPIAVIADQAVIRGVVTVLNWFLNDAHKAFKPSDVAGVAEYLKVTEDETRTLFELAHELTPE
jgi:hypothetical protein